MAKTPATPAVLMAGPLLAAIAAGTVTRVTEAQAGSLDAAHYEVNTSDVNADGALIRLTEAGTAAAAGTPAAPAAKSAGSIDIDDDVVMPEGLARRRAPTEGLYPFDKLNVGQSFHVAKSAENPDPATRLSSSVSGAHIRYSPPILGADGKPEQEEYKSPVYQREADGKTYSKDADGKRVKLSEETKTRDKRGEPTRTFRIVPVDASDKRGEGARVFRVK